MSVVVTIVPTVGEADEIAALLETEGIECAYPWYVGAKGVDPGYEIRVSEADYERAFELIEANTAA